MKEQNAKNGAKMQSFVDNYHVFILIANHKKH